VTPVADDCVGVAILSSSRGGFDAHFDEFPHLKERLSGHDHGQDRAAGPLWQKVVSRTAGRVLLVGDAAGYIDALTGEGMGLAFGAAELLVDCVIADRTGDYDRQYAIEVFDGAGGAGARGCHDAVRRRIVPAATMLPGVFAAMVDQLAGVPDYRTCWRAIGLDFSTRVSFLVPEGT
jgi:hypothetical protein